MAPQDTPRARRPPIDLTRLPSLHDRIAPGIRVLFVGINPGVRSALTGHHFAGFSNRFWKLLHESRLVPEPLTAEDDVRLAEWGYGVTNLVARASPGIDDLKPDDYVSGRRKLIAKVARYRPEIVALVGVTLYRALFPSKPVRRQPLEQVVGLREEALAGARVFVLPNPSGRNANFSYGEMLAAFADLHRYVSSHDLR